MSDLCQVNDVYQLAAFYERRGEKCLYQDYKDLNQIQTNCSCFLICNHVNTVIALKVEKKCNFPNKILLKSAKLINS